VGEEGGGCTWSVRVRFGMHGWCYKKHIMQEHGLPCWAGVSNSVTHPSTGKDGSWTYSTNHCKENYLASFGVSIKSIGGFNPYL
jgi:hypothetical protein